MVQSSNDIREINVSGPSAPGDIDIDDNDAEVELNDDSKGEYTVDFCAENSGSYIVEVLTESRIFGYRFYFQRPAGIRNGGFFPLTENQQPILNQQNGIYVELYGTSLDVDSIDFSFISVNGENVLKTFSLPILESDNNGASFEGSVLLDFTQEFYLQINGQRTDSESFIRVLNYRTFQAQYPSVQVVNERDTFQYGPDQDSHNFEFEITNNDSSSRDYNLSVDFISDNEDAFSARFFSDKIKSIATSSISVGSGQSKTIFVELTVDDHDDLDSGDLIAFSLVASTSGSNNKNAVDISGQYVGCGGNPVCLGNGVCNSETDECECNVGQDCGDNDNDDDDDIFDIFSPSSNSPNSPNSPNSSNSPNSPNSPNSSFFSPTSVFNSPSGSPNSNSSSATSLQATIFFISFCFSFLL